MQNSKIELTMSITQGFDCSKTAYEADANFFEKDGKFFLLFDETNDDDGDLTKCRFEISKHALRMRRNGPIVLEQTHVKAQETKGYIKTPFGHVATSVQTSQLSFKKSNNATYYLELGYELYTGEEKTGTYSLEITIRLKEGNRS